MITCVSKLLVLVQAANFTSTRWLVGRNTNLASLSLKFCDRSAASEAAGEDPLMPLKNSWLPRCNAFLSRMFKEEELGPRGLGPKGGPKRF